MKQAFNQTPATNDSLNVKHFSDIQIDYTYQEAERKTLYFQGALITFTAEVTAEVK